MQITDEITSRYYDLQFDRPETKMQSEIKFSNIYKQCRVTLLNGFYRAACNADAV